MPSFRKETPKKGSQGRGHVHPGQKTLDRFFVKPSSTESAVTVKMEPTHYHSAPVNRETNMPNPSVSSTVKSTAQQLASTAQQLASTAQQLASAVQRVASTDQRVTSTDQRVTSTCCPRLSNSDHVTSTTLHVPSTAHLVTNAAQQVPSAIQQVTSAVQRVPSMCSSLLTSINSEPTLSTTLASKLIHSKPAKKYTKMLHFTPSRTDIATPNKRADATPYHTPNASGEPTLFLSALDTPPGPSPISQPSTPVRKPVKSEPREFTTPMGSRSNFGSPASSSGKGSPRAHGKRRKIEPQAGAMLKYITKSPRASQHTPEKELDTAMVRISSVLNLLVERHSMYNSKEIAWYNFILCG